ncbi:MAG: asparagine synthase (glutamine-hydrolyzing) [Nitrospirae bacterium]|nr:asparagine synthase (glutamine-hydrolyzing) [Nitrospirota bacterium]
MCGICGIIDLKEEREISGSLIESMCNSMIHRGPDGQGLFLEGSVGLGMRRLSIIDLQTGWQPIYNETRDVVAFQNGEIYNYQALRSSLLDLGHHFSTDSDTEVLVHLYEEYGEDCVNHLNGMFAIAIYDAKRKRLLLARDKVGIKPLFYSVVDHFLVFGSEIKTVLASGLVSNRVDSEGVNDYFTFLYVVAPRTIYQEIQELPPGCILKYENGRIDVRRYWELHYESEDSQTDLEYAEQFLDLFRGAVRRQLVSDVPLGAFLSGGVDSTAVVGVMSEFTGEPVKTFTIGYGSKEAYYDERKIAREISTLYQTDHHEFVLDANVLKYIDDIVNALDQPFGNSSVLPNYVVCQETRKYVTVALSGLGGDELFAGYERYVGLKLSRMYRRVPQVVRRQILEKLATYLPDSRKGSNFSQRLKRFIAYGNSPAERMYYNLMASYDDQARRDFFSQDFSGQISLTRPFSEFEEVFNKAKNVDDVDRAMFADFNRYLPGDLLTLTDRMSMAHSLETRVPFLDSQILDFVARLPLKQKLRGWTKKYLLALACKGLVPDRVLHGRKKGFSVPLVLWFREELRDYVLSVLSQKRIEGCGLFNWESVEAMLNLHFSGKENYFSRIWALFVFMLWHDKRMGTI